jgi:hypothetical protein
MFSGKRSIATVGVLTVVGIGGVSVAATRNAPAVKRLEGDIVFTHIAGKLRTCPGEDGVPWTEAVFTATGTASGDPLLAGDVSARFSVLAGADGGFNHGWLQIREPGTARWKAQGRFFQSEIDEIDQGIFVGEVRNPRSGGGDQLRLFAGMRTLFVPGGTFTAQLGGEVPDGRLPATATGGRCTGPFQRFAVDVPSPSENRGAAPTSAGRFGW